SWIASYTFVAVTGDLRRDLFRHLTGHAPSYFADRMPGTLTSRITATSNAVFTLQNMSIWNVLPPCMATLIAIAFVVTVSAPMAAVLMGIAGILVLAMFRLAAAGRPLHHEFANRAAAVDGEMVDVVGNMSLVWSFCGIGREHRRLDATIDREMTARRRSLLYLEKLRLFHAVVTVVLIIALLAWAIALWQKGAATAGDVVLVCTLGLSILHARGIWRWRWWTSPNTWRACRRRWRRFSCRTACAITPRRPRWCARAPRSHSRTSTFVIPTGAGCSAISTCVSSPASASVWSASRAAASRPCSCCCSVSTTCRGGAFCSVAKTLRGSPRRACAPPSPSFPRTYPCFTARSWRTSAMVGRTPPMPTYMRRSSRPIATT